MLLVVDNVLQYWPGSTLLTYYISNGKIVLLAAITLLAATSTKLEI